MVQIWGYLAFSVSLCIWILTTLPYFQHIFSSFFFFYIDVPAMHDPISSIINITLMFGLRLGPGNNAKTVRGARGATAQNGRWIFFLQSFVESRPIETQTRGRVPRKIYITQKPQDEQPFWNVEQSAMKINPKNPLTLKIFASIQSRRSR